jgi:hypothetical protein
MFVKRSKRTRINPLKCKFQYTPVLCSEISTHLHINFIDRSNVALVLQYSTAGDILDNILCILKFM